ncbi:hypothetical protein VTL71DRAFT_10363 [Oculimacula yallundae]|uniref:2EXR domain-containing protein n=1 Tax=Oculimacula yallundae TaxID=86028 RepID=A0ABR4CVD4_9HELO
MSPTISLSATPPPPAYSGISQSAPITIAIAPFNPQWSAAMQSWSQNRSSAPLTGTTGIPFNGNAGQTFDYFTKLPLLVQCMIWSLVLPAKRIVKIVGRNYTKAQLKDDSFRKACFRAMGSLINVFAVNRDSRAFAIAQYGASGNALGGLVDSNSCYVNQRMGDRVMFVDMAVLGSFARVYMKIHTGILMTIGDYQVPPIFNGMDTTEIMVGWTPQPTAKAIATHCLHLSCIDYPRFRCNIQPKPSTYIQQLLHTVSQFGNVQTVCLVHNTAAEMVLNATDLPAMPLSTPPATFVNEVHKRVFEIDWVYGVDRTLPGDQKPKFTGLRLSKWIVPEFVDALKGNVDVYF